MNNVKQLWMKTRMIPKLSLIIIINILVVSKNVRANSFVGNGGSTADVEILVTKKQIYESLKKVSETEEFVDYCECIPIYNNRNMCAPLEKLDSEQKRYCTQQLKNISSKIVKLIDDPSLVINWTNQTINIKNDHNEIVADAIANNKNKTITLNKRNFISLSQSQRVFLLTHELIHMVPIEGKFLSDFGAVGPFKNQQGSRDLINSMASETVMQVQRYSLFQKYQPVLSRGQSSYMNWLDLTLIYQGGLENNSNVYSADSHTGFELSYRRFIKKWGFNLGFKSILSSEKLLTNVEVENRLSTLSLGLSYRFFMNDDPLTAFGQSFLVVDANVDFVVSKYEISDAFVSTENKDDAVGYSLNANYYYPLNPFWIKFGLGVNQANYSHESLNLDRNAINITGHLGVSYGF